MRYGRHKNHEMVVGRYRYVILKILIQVDTNLVGDGGGYEIPRWLGDNRFECPELGDAPGTSSVLLLMYDGFKFKFGKLCPKLRSGCTTNVFADIAFNFVGLFCGTFFVIIPLPPTPPAPCNDETPSSLDNEFVFSQSIDTVFDSVNSTDPLKTRNDNYKKKKITV